MSYFSAALSCGQREFFLVIRLLSEILLSFVIVKSDRLNKSKVESGKPAKTRASQGTNPIGIGEKDNILKISIYAFSVHIKPQLIFFPLE